MLLKWKIDSHFTRPPVQRAEDKISPLLDLQKKNPDIHKKKKKKKKFVGKNGSALVDSFPQFFPLFIFITSATQISKPSQGVSARHDFTCSP